MENPDVDELRLRITIDRDTPDLLRRLVGTRRQAREALHLMRLGLRMEAMLSRAPAVGFSGSDAGERPQSPVEQGGESVPRDPVKTPTNLGLPTGAEIAALSGLDADYFSAPISHLD